jgi:hypothetical protein
MFPWVASVAMYHVTSAPEWDAKKPKHGGAGRAWRLTEGAGDTRATHRRAIKHIRVLGQGRGGARARVSALLRRHGSRKRAELVCQLRAFAGAAFTSLLLLFLQRIYTTPPPESSRPFLSLARCECKRPARAAVRVLERIPGTEFT